MFEIAQNGQACRGPACISQAAKLRFPLDHHSRFLGCQVEQRRQLPRVGVQVKIWIRRQQVGQRVDGPSDDHRHHTGVERQQLSVLLSPAQDALQCDQERLLLNRRSPQRPWP